MANRAFSLLAASSTAIVYAACAGNTPASPADAGSPDAAPTSAQSCGPTPTAVDVVTQRMQAKRGTMGMAANAMVSSSHTRATQIGVDTLRRGGNAVDAFIATTLAEDVVLPGVTSTAGLTGFLVYQASTQSVFYVHGPLKATKATGAGVGGQVLVPGEVAALAYASQKLGHLPLADVVAPVATLARQGFPIDRIYAGSIRANRTMLSQSAYGQTAFFKNGQPLAEGDLLAQPDVATTLEGIAASGADYFYRGAWATRFVATVNAAGGAATADDLATYQAMLVAPLMARYRDAYLFTSAGYSWGGARLLLALKTLEHVDLSRLGRFSESGAALALLLRVHDAESTQQSWLQDPAVLSQPSVAAARIDAGSAALWSMVQSSVPPASVADGGTHSSAVVVVDAAGNVVVGTHTIDATNWGLGLFVGGLPLSTSASVHPELVPGGIATDPLSCEIAFVGGKPRLAMSTYGTGLHPGDVQVMSNVLDFGMTPEDAVLTPRAGFYAYSLVTQGGTLKFTFDPTTHLLDERVPMSVVCDARARGLGVQQREPDGYPPGVIDTGFPVVVTLDAAPGPGRLKGMTPEWMEGAAAGF